MARLTLVVVAVCLACAPIPAPSTQSAAAPVPPGTDTAGLVRAGLGSLRQEDVALRLQLQGLEVRALPLDESIIRTLSPDSYRSLHELVASQREAVSKVERRTGQRAVSVWYVSFFGTEVGEVRFSPMEMIVTSVGRDFRPLDVVPLTPGFGAQRLRQRETQSALFIFDGQIDVNQPLSVQFETAQNSDWPAVLARVERERALIRSRSR
ncbi:MAG: hypothetical protein MNPFHGCM_00732 [Gemmatimonadaceae bacterium]|nr:hypothetical protein [Gemmatimonadaceae bacterium]